ncbi:MAG: hypothetical protein Q9167_004646 [Letrouitia subvulpina]
MFLTSRESGVATIWLVATLGSKSVLKKVNRKAILDVNVPKACRVIINPEAPMALRLQSNLLLWRRQYGVANSPLSYGVSRVFLSQCGYTLSDAQNIQTNMKTLLTAVRAAQLDPEAGKARYVVLSRSNLQVLISIRPEQLVLQDDPAFHPEMQFPDFDLSALDMPMDGSSYRSSILSPHAQQSSHSSQSGVDSMIGLVIPTSDTGDAGDFGGLVLPSSERGSIRPSAGIGRIFDDEEDGFELDPGFTIDVDGNLILTGEEPALPQPPAAPAASTRIRSDSGMSARIAQEVEGLQGGRFGIADEMDLGLGLPEQFEEVRALPEAEPFPLMTRHELPLAEEQTEEEEGSSSSTELPHRRKRRVRRELPVDSAQELRSAHLSQWNNEYLSNMQAAKKFKQQFKASTLAKKNAAGWVFGAGLGGIGTTRGQSKLETPLNMFAGDALMEVLVGTALGPARMKRSRSPGDERSDSEERRVRTRNYDDVQMGRGNELVLGDDETMQIPGSETVEMGRHARPSLADNSLMPWNRSASIRDSRQSSITRGHGFVGNVSGLPTSSRGMGSLPPIGRSASLDRRASRITSASPLMGRGPERYSELEVPQGEYDDLLGGPSTPVIADDFHIYGPAAGVSTQTAAQSQWMRAALDTESNNFLEYLRAEIRSKVIPRVEEEDELAGEVPEPEFISFEELLPPAENTKIVAAQALHHVLALATKGLINVQQREHYGPIHLGVSHTI